MSNIDKQALREAAEKATPRDWRRASTRFNGITSQAVYPLCCKEEILANTAEKRDAEFIAAANPATVLALLDELEAKDKRIAELSQKADIYDMLRQDYGLQGSLVDFVDWQAKRIAELSHHLQSAHAFIEHTEAFGYEASNGILCCGDAQWNIDASKAALASTGRINGED